MNRNERNEPILTCFAKKRLKLVKNGFINCKMCLCIYKDDLAIYRWMKFCRNSKTEATYMLDH